MRSAVKRSSKRRRPASPIARAGARSLQHLDEGRGERLRVARGHDAAGHAVLDRLGDAAGGGGHDGAREAHRVEQAGAEPLHVRRQAEDVEGGDEPVEVGAEARRRRRGPRRPRARACASQRGRSSPSPDDHEAGLGHRARTRAAASSSVAWSLWSVSAATLPTTGAPAGTPRARSARRPPAAGGPVGHALVDDADAVAGQRRPPRATRAIARLTAITRRQAPYFQRESGPRSGKSTRRRARSGGSRARGGARPAPRRPRAGRAGGPRPAAVSRTSRTQAQSAPGEKSPRKAIGRTARPAARARVASGASAPAGHARPRARARPCPARSAGPGSARRARRARCRRAGSSSRARGARPARWSFASFA